MKYDLFIFDLDGTICDSFEGIKASIGYMMDKLGYPKPSDETYREIIGPPFFYSMKHILNVKENLHQEGMNLYRGFFAEEGYKLFSLYEGIRHVLQSIHAMGAKIALATSKPISPTLKLLRYFGLTEHFDSINAPADDTVKNSKEFAIGEALKVPHRKAVMIGDRKFDGVGAAFYKLDFVGAGYGCGSTEELLQAGAIKVLDSVNDYYDYFELPVVNGKFVSVEGMDGSGKTTQIKLLVEKMKRFGFRFVCTREPGGTKISEEIRQMLLSTENMEMHPKTEALLYAAARSQHVQQLIKPNLEQGRSVLCDRFVDSSIAYQGGGRRLGYLEVKSINDFAIDSALPDRTIYLQMDASKALQRRAKASELDRLESEKEAFFMATQAVYSEILTNDADRFIVVNADDNVDSISEVVFKHVASVLDEKVNWNECKYE